MFERPHHLRIATLLEALDGAKLLELGCLFGGGTAIVLMTGEYRESVDVDFLVSDAAGYRTLRQGLTGPKGLRTISRPGLSFDLAGDIRADQYGVRTLVRISGVEVKLEFVFESRIELEKPGLEDQVCGVATLTRLDLAASRLLANSDRWADDSVFSPDVIDLAMLGPDRKTLRAALAKARKAYGEAVDRDLEKAITRLKERRGRLDACIQALSIDSTPKALLWKRLKRLLPVTSPSPRKRVARARVRGRRARG